jgi:hypothetical protein|tara:strand:- start:850 stop:1095 length:246 start_codon:yes stop_codon:yes gene_type:complete
MKKGERTMGNNKIIIPTEKWVELYADLSCYVESKCYPNRTTHNQDGERLQETEDDFHEIVDDVENIMRLCGFAKQGESNGI